MLTVMTHLWHQPNGRATYTADQVNIWADMVSRHLSVPHRLACVTDHPEGIIDRVEIITPPHDFDDVRIPTWGEHMPQCLRRISMFRPDAAEIYGERFVNMDLDCVISGALDPLFDRDEDFVMYRGTTASRPYNGSMVMMTAGARSEVFERFTPEGAIVAGQRFLGSDQAWISHVLGEGEATWGPEHGVQWWGSRYNQGDPIVTFFPGNPKPWQVLDHALVRDNYRRDPQGKALLLGYAPNVWSDVESAMAEHEFDAVIASPEAAEHWPEPVLAVVRDDEHAEVLAHMHGYEPIWCGKSAQPESA